MTHDAKNNKWVAEMPFKQVLHAWPTHNLSLDSDEDVAESVKMEFVSVKGFRQ